MKKNNIILDLDQTLIYGEPVKGFGNSLYSKASNFTFHNMDQTYIIFERPYLQEFLDFIFDNFNVIVWTAASKDYALFVIEKVILKKPNRILKFIFTSYHCRISEKTNKHEYTKDLQLLWNKFNISDLSFQNTFIIDDYKSDVYISQPKNCILAPEFVFKNQNSENDTFLKDLIPKMKELISADDIRPIISKINNIKETTTEEVNKNENETDTTTEHETSTDDD